MRTQVLILAVEECANVGIITFPELPMAWLMRKEGCKELRKQGNKARESDSDQTRRGSEMIWFLSRMFFQDVWEGKFLKILGSCM